MSKTRINFSQVRACEDELKDIFDIIEKDIESLDNLKNNRHIKSYGFDLLYSNLEKKISDLKEIGSSIGILRETLSDIRQRYQLCEDKVFEELSAGESTSEGSFVVENQKSNSAAPQNNSVRKKLLDIGGVGLDMISQMGILGSFVGLCKGSVSSKTSWGALANISKGTNELVEKFAHIATNDNAGWRDVLNFNKMKKTGAFKVLKKNAKDLVKGKNVVETAAKRAGIVLDTVIEGVENYNEHKGFSAEMVAETVIETGTSIGLHYLVGAAVTMVAGTVGAPAVVAAAATVGIIAVANIVTEKITGKDIGEHVSDTLAPHIVRGIEKIREAVGYSANLFQMQARGGQDIICIDKFL